MNTSQQDLGPFVHDLYEPEKYKEKDASKDDDKHASDTGKKKKSIQLVVKKISV